MNSTVVRRVGSVFTAAIATTALLFVLGATESKAGASGWCKDAGQALTALATDICRR
ncbi:hypothetical protein M8C13_23275 [Crossiella sp. SN42]|uniref:hypothetical protein n=1 Tax=Crossiella sp. SN42 TaxID=2944808 RepID=UPI00207CF4F7|nr:hypothetical protein [Crossiella sp. SN42]MCO1578680.1 hypothetical protein [Crossiella sp. SN42]